MSTPEKPRERVALSIGTLSGATGVPVDTLRTWERRYGFPVATRTGGSHRRYPVEAIGQIRLIVRALQLGHRPSAVMGRDLEELHRLIATDAPGDVASQPEPLEPAASGAAPASDAGDQSAVARWLAHACALEGEALDGELQRSLAEMPVLDFLSRRLGPYLLALGDAWQRGELRVYEEHFASERVREFLTRQWRGLSGGARTARALVLATPPGELHVLGLHMAAWVVALAGVRVVFLGASTPMAELASAAARHRCSGVLLSVSAGYPGHELEVHVDELRRQLPPSLPLWVGGAGSTKLEAERKMNRFEVLFDWCSNLADNPRTTGI